MEEKSTLDVSCALFPPRQVVIDLGAAPLDGEADWYTLTSHEESVQILVSQFDPIFNGQVTHLSVMCVCLCVCVRRGGRDCRCPSRRRRPWALWTICRRLRPRRASQTLSPTLPIWATGRKAAVEAVAVVAAAAAAHFCLLHVTPEELSSAVSAVTGPQSAAWAAVPGTGNSVALLLLVVVLFFSSSAPYLPFPIDPFLIDFAPSECLLHVFLSI